MFKNISIVNYLNQIAQTKLCGFPHNFALKHIFINSNKRKLRKMVEKTYPMTLEEKEKLEKELEELKLVRRPEVVERIKIARSYGDLSENSEYEAAKDEQAFVEGQISSLETKIRYAEIVNSDAVAKNEVAIGKTVTIQEVGEDEKEVYIIVGSAGADAFAGKVSNESPIGQALIGKKKGDVVTIETPAGSYDVKILKVEKTA